MADLISRQAAIDIIDNYMDKSIELHYLPTSDGIKKLISVLPSAQPEQSEEDCDTCKHGYFGDSQCDNCRVGYPSRYERRTDE